MLETTCKKALKMNQIMRLFGIAESLSIEPTINTIKVQKYKTFLGYHLQKLLIFVRIINVFEGWRESLYFPLKSIKLLKKSHVLGIWYILRHLSEGTI